MGSALLLLPLLAGAALLIGLVELTIRRTYVGALLVSVVAVIEALRVQLPPVAFGQVNVYPADLAAVILVTAAAARLMRSRRLTPAQHLLLVVASIAAVSLVRGIAAFGLEDAVDEARRWIMLLTAALYFSTVRPSPSMNNRIGRYLVAVGTVILAAAVLRWAALATGFTPIAWLSSPDGLRVVPSTPALLIAIAAIVLAPAWRSAPRDRRDRVHRRLGVALLSATVLLQHRTVWAALLAAVAVAVVHDPSLGRRFGAGLAGALLVAGLLVGTVLGDGPDTFRERATNAQTFEWRLEGWRQLIGPDTFDDPVDVLIGHPFGTGWEREVFGEIRTETPHSLYIEGLLRLGLVGLAALLASFLIPLHRLWTRNRGTRLREHADRMTGRPLLGAETLLYLIVVLIVHGLTYFPPVVGGLVLGLALAATGVPTAGGTARLPLRPAPLEAPGGPAQRAPAPTLTLRRSP